MSGLSILKNSSFIILVGLAMMLVAFLVVWSGSQITVTKTSDCFSRISEVSPKNYSYRCIPYEPGWNTHLSFTAEGANINYMLLDYADLIMWELEGQLPDDWVEASSDFSHWEDGISEIVGCYFFYNEDLQPKTVHVEYFYAQDIVSINYFYINGGFSLLILGAGIFISGLCKRLPALNSNLTFAISGSSYLSVLLVSYLMPLFYPYLTPYCWLLIPVVANFFVGYFVREVQTAVKIIIASLLLHTSIVIGLLMVPSIYDAFKSYFENDSSLLIVLLVLGYPVVHTILGVTISFIAVMVRYYIGELKKLLLNRM